jgi:hypothetical protein
MIYSFQLGNIVEVTEHCGENVSLDNAFVLIERHPVSLGATRQSGFDEFHSSFWIGDLDD